jgi:hypothetical protein
MSNIGVRESYIPVPVTRRFNEPISPTAAHSQGFSDPIAMFEDYSEIDKALWEIQNNPTAWRSDKDEKKVEALTQTIEYAFFYGSIATNPAQFVGLANRFKSLTTYPNNDTSWFYNVLSSGGAAANSGAFTSAWMIEMGKGKVYGIYPRNLPGGLSVRDLGESTKETTAGLYQVLRMHFRWFAGLVVEDERCVQRICNIDTTSGVSTGIFDEETFIDAKNRLPGSGEAPGTVIFVNRLLKSQIDKRAVTQKLNTYFTQNEDTGDVWGRSVTRFQGIPIFVAEKILSTETTIS